MATANLICDVVEIGSLRAPLTIRRNPRARRIILRVDKQNDGLVLTVPNGVSVGEARAFLDQNRDWAARCLGGLPARVPFAAGAMVPYLGEPHVVRHAPELTGGVWRDRGQLIVCGNAAHLPRRLTDWLKQEARRELAAAARRHAAALERPVGRVTVRDTRTRWGSCSRTGNLSFSWRLILAPHWVLDYVAAHEVVHLAIRNHSKQFWARLRRLCPATDRAEAWLREHGGGLHRYGAATGNSASANIG